jgi:hypothetical protein
MISTSDIAVKNMYLMCELSIGMVDVYVVRKKANEVLPSTVLHYKNSVM